MEFISIDGSYGEGGGQILRTSITLSAITKKAVEIVKIRSKRDNPGLRPQHVNAINAVASLCNARIENVSVGSDTIKFIPDEMRSDSIKIDVGTAGSVTLILQAVVPAVSLSGKRAEIELRGGTDVRWSPTLDYLRFVIQPAFSMIGIDFDVNVRRRGYYPKGGGIVEATIEPCKKLNSFDVTSTSKIEPKIVSVCSSLPAYVAQRQIAAALAKLQKANVACNSYSASLEQSSSPGSSILVYSVSNYGPFIGGDAIGERGKRAEDVGAEAAERFLESYNSNAPVDQYLADMIVLPLCFTSEESRFITNKASQHLLTNLYVIDKIVGCKYDVSNTNGNYTVTIKGRS